jgi:hypothetical protein
MPHQDREKRREYAKKYYQEHKKELIDYGREYYKNHRISTTEYMPHNIKNVARKKKEDEKGIHDKMVQRRIRRKTKLEIYNIIAVFHEHGIQCWRCGENKEWLLTIGHIDGNGKEDRMKYNGTGNMSLFRDIKKGNRSVKDLEIECISCNLCKQWYGIYPDEMDEKKFNEFFGY